MIPITITKPEAQLCRDAAKLAKSEEVALPFLDAGEAKLSREIWFEFSRYLIFCGTDFECERELSTRRRFNALAARIERVIWMYDTIHRGEPKPARESTKASKPRQLAFEM